MHGICGYGTIGDLGTANADHLLHLNIPHLGPQAQDHVPSSRPHYTPNLEVELEKLAASYQPKDNGPHHYRKYKDHQKIKDHINKSLL